MSTQSNLNAFSVQALVKIINGLVERAEISATWQVSRKWTKEELITHLDALCNEYPAILRVINEDAKLKAIFAD
jgi:cytochrome oxidase assembly protein ShyY1